jgi:hypothetical protein
VFWALSRFSIPTDAHQAPALFAVLGIANTLPWLLGGITLGGAVAYYEGRPYRLSPAAQQRLACKPERARLVLQFLSYYRPADEREALLRDQAHHQAHRIVFWVLYLGAIAYLILAALSLPILARFGFVFLDLLLVASMSLPQSIILWSTPDIESEDRPSEEAECAQN